MLLKTPGRQLTSITGITGVTVLADTSIVLILNPEEFLGRQSVPVVTDDVQLLESPLSQQEEAVPETKMESVNTDIDIAAALENVLVVDDSLVVRKVMQRDLEGLGLNVVVALDGINALEVLESVVVDMALIDLEMPRMNGYELLIKLREDPKFMNLPVIVITSRGADLHKSRAINLGADAYITKPYNLTALQQMMKSVIAEKVTVY